MNQAAYFTALDAELRTDGPGCPVLVLDLDRLDHNCAAIRARWSAGKALRIVGKSLPCLPLLAHVMERMHTARQMVFHAPFVLPTLTARPDDQLLVGKPFPIRAVEAMFAADAVPARALAERVTWLIDTRERLAKYAALARAQGLHLRVALEVDVGMRRGGFATPPELAAAIASIEATVPLHVVGLMGYDAHVGATPRLLQTADEAHARACADYRAFVDALPLGARSILNGAGSRTFRRHGADSPLTELAIGSAFVLPARFDGPLLDDLQPALFIAAPVLRATDGTKLPGLEWSAPLWSRALARYERSYFMYGGRYDAVFVWPPELVENKLYGGSYNQTLVNGPAAHAVEVDQHVFLRPNDSEALMLQFGDLWVVRRGRLKARWPVLQPWS